MALRQGIGPTTVFGRVTETTIYAVKGHAKWRLPHIGKEVFKLMPTLAYFYASCAVSMELFILWIITALHHAPPRVAYTAASFTVCGNRFSLLFSSIAAARCGWALSFERVTSHIGEAAAVALAKPAQIFTWYIRALKNDKSPIALTDEFCWLHSHTIAITKV
jgi:hypothetical protein